MMVIGQTSIGYSKKRQLKDHQSYCGLMHSKINTNETGQHPQGGLLGICGLGWNLSSNMQQNLRSYDFLFHNSIF